MIFFVLLSHSFCRYPCRKVGSMLEVWRIPAEQALLEHHGKVTGVAMAINHVKGWEIRYNVTQKGLSEEMHGEGLDAEL